MVASDESVPPKCPHCGKALPAFKILARDNAAKVMDAINKYQRRNGSL